MLSPAGTGSGDRLAVRAQPRARHLARRVLFIVSRAGLWWVLAVVLVSVDPPVTPPVLFRLVAALVVLPGCAAALLRGRPAVATIEGDALVVATNGTRLEIPCRAISGIQPSRLPLPDVHLTIVLRSGRRVVPDLDADDPVPLLTALGDAGAPAEAALAAPAVVTAAARAATPRRWFDHPAVKFGLAAIAPALILFNAHQHISYGGFWGEYYTYGPLAWSTTLAVYLGATAVYCLLWASVWRGLAELTAFAAAAVAPSRAAWVRRRAETACRLAYWGGIPLLLLLRFLP